MDLLKLFSPGYLFDTLPGSEFSLRIPVYGFFILLVIASFFIAKELQKRPYAKLESEFFGGIPYRLREFAVLGLIFTFMRDQNVPYLGMRFLLVLTPILLLAYLVYVWRNYQKNFAVKLANKTAKRPVDKYIPKKKGRK